MNKQNTVVVIDTSAVLAFLNEEPGWQTVQECLLHGRGLMSTVNFAELVTKLAVNQNKELPSLHELIVNLDIQLVELSVGTAFITGTLITKTRHKGLSLGDRACLALALEEGAMVLTSDRSWLELDLPLSIHNFRAQAAPS